MDGPVDPPLQLRPLRLADAAACAELIRVAGAADRTGMRRTEAQVLADAARTDLAADTLAVLDGAVLVGVHVLMVSRGAVGIGDTLRAHGTVAPGHRGRGIGTILVAHARHRAAELGMPLLVRVLEADAGAVGIVTDAGLVPVRWWSELTRDLREPIIPTAVPDGVQVARLGPGYDAGRWDERLRAAHNTAFAAHFGSVAVPVDDWHRDRTGSSTFRSDLSAAAVVDDRVVAYVLCYELVPGDLHVMTVGTIDEWRGRGLAAALLAQVLAAAAAAGFGSSSLTVDTANPTGALGVYARAGYRPAWRAVSYVTSPA